MNLPVPRPFSVQEAAVLLGLHEDTIRAQIHSGAIVAVKVGRAYRIPVTEMARLTGEPEKATA